ncbi:helix-turn-helix domain-containing protein [Pseudomonas sp. RIT-To-2]|uniref:helix-turn-helix domain-containing protein n=1 Tax=Pseudomonas sp. RIT-To-2 TaxID=3462541 RepID=UPI0024135B7C
MNIDEAFGLVLREMREYSKLNQDAFGAAAARTYIGRLERGEHSPTLERIVKIAEVLEIDPLVLILWAFDRSRGKEPGTSGEKGSQTLRRIMAAMLELKEKD